MKLRPRTWTTGAAIVLVIVAGILLTWYTTKPSPRLYGQVGSHKVDEAELAATLQNSVKVSTDQAVTALLDRWLYAEIAKDYGLSVTDKEINDELAKRTGGAEQFASHNYLMVIVARDLYRQKIEAELDGYLRGRYIVASFDRYIVSPDLPAYPDNPVAGRTGRIAADRKYAGDFMNGLYAKLNSHQLSFDQAMELERKDPRLGEAAYPTNRHSAGFDTGVSRSENGLLGLVGVDTQIAQLKPGTYSAPFVLKRAGSDAVETAYMMIGLDANKPKAELSFDEVVSRQKATLKYRKF